MCYSTKTTWTPLFRLQANHVFALTPKWCVIRGEPTNTYFHSLYLTRQELEPTIYHTWHESNMLTTDAISLLRPRTFHQSYSTFFSGLRQNLPISFCILLLWPINILVVHCNLSTKSYLFFLQIFQSFIHHFRH